MKHRFLTIGLLIILSCSTKKENHNTILPDSTEFKIKNDSSEQQKEQQNQTVLSRDMPLGQPISFKQVKKWSAEFDTLLTTEYSIVKDSIGKSKTSIIHVSGTDYLALLLLTFDKNDNLIDYYEIAGGEYDMGYDQVGNQLFSSTFKQAIMNSDTEFRIQKVQNVIPVGQKSGHLKKLDEWKITINDSGEIIGKRLNWK